MSDKKGNFNPIINPVRVVRTERPLTITVHDFYVNIITNISTYLDTSNPDWINTDPVHSFRPIELKLDEVSDILPEDTLTYTVTEEVHLLLAEAFIHLVKGAVILDECQDPMAMTNKLTKDYNTVVNNNTVSNISTNSDVIEQLDKVYKILGARTNFPLRAFSRLMYLVKLSPSALFSMVLAILVTAKYEREAAQGLKVTSSILRKRTIKYLAKNNALSDINDMDTDKLYKIMRGVM